MKIIESGDKGGMMSEDIYWKVLLLQKIFQISILNYYIQYMALTKIGCMHLSKDCIDWMDRLQIHIPIESFAKTFDLKW